LSFLGVSGGIACLKAADLAIKLVQAGLGSKTSHDKRATEFITPLTFRETTPVSRGDGLC
jgi:phosphopantothenoylcysteine decarboxylase/phosphopantothenate--cysteine ligase